MTTKIVASGGTVVLADHWFPSSKTCHHCVHIHQELTLSDRTYNCLNCGTVIDRNLNAALVLSQYGEVNQKTRWAVPKVTPVNWKEPTPQVEAGNKHQD